MSEQFLGESIEGIELPLRSKAPSKLSINIVEHNGKLYLHLITELSTQIHVARLSPKNARELIEGLESALDRIGKRKKPKK